jgi:hypothetical protein
MTKWKVICAARATIQEVWHVDADSAESAREIMEDYAANGGEGVEFIGQDVDGEEEEREVRCVLELPEDFPPVPVCAREAAPDLLAAAPDLLAACEAAAQLLLNDPNRVRDGWMTDIIRQLRKAIAKANGAAAVEQEFPSLSLDNMSRETPWENEQ